MEISYNVYRNDGRGGPVNYQTPIASTASLSYTSGLLPFSSDTTFAIRAQSMATGLEESNTEARVRVILDSSGLDVSAQPNPPHTLMVRATPGGSCMATWGYNPVGQAGAPTAFEVYLTRGTAAAYGNMVATVPYIAGTNVYRCNLPGLADGATYAVAVRASNPTVIERNTSAVALVVGDSTPPGNVDGLVGVATFAYQ